LPDTDVDGRPLPLQFKIRVRAQMRAKIAHSAILATAILSVAGCKSGPRWNWWSSKEKSNHEELVNAPGAPQLPSAAATASAAGTPSLNASSANAHSGLTGAMAPSYGAGGYAEQPAAATSYPQSYPATQTAEYTNPYTTGAAAVNATAAMPSSVGQPQQGAYNPVYQQQAQQTNPYVDPNVSRQMPAQDSYHGAYGQAPAASQADPNYRSADPNYRTADVRSTPAYDNRGAETQPRYDAGGEMSSPDYTRPSYSGDAQTPAAAPAGAANRYAEPYQSGASEYKPGASDYTPGNTGYNGPRSYDANPAMPAQGAPAGVEQRKDPGYRPGGTSDYLPAGRVGGAAGAGFSTSMNSTPAKSSTGGVVTAGYQQPSSGESVTPARFQPQDNAPVSTLTIGRRSYE
jgi:hypothetical protein